MIVMSGHDVAKKLEKNIKQEMKQFDKNKIVPTLAIVRIGNSSDAIAYEKSAEKKLTELNIQVVTYSYSESITEDKFLIEFEKINDNPLIHGILLLRPLPNHIKIEKLTELINPKKDVDGMSAVNLGKIMYDDATGLLPSTPAGIMEIFSYYAIDLKGKDIVIIGHSEVVGKPLSILLLNEDATVTVSHVFTKNIKEKTKKADIIISAVGKADLITEDQIKDGAIVIDVGITYKNGEITGDVSYEEVSKKTSYITPVPGGVGAVTTIMLASNVLKATKLVLESDNYTGDYLKV